MKSKEWKADKEPVIPAKAGIQAASNLPLNHSTHITLNSTSNIKHQTSSSEHPPHLAILAKAGIHFDLVLIGHKG